MAAVQLAGHSVFVAVGRPARASFFPPAACVDRVEYALGSD